MRFRTALAIIIAVVGTVFFIMNWGLFATPVKLNLLVTSVDAPVGLVMIALFAVVLAVLSSYVGVWQGTLLMEFRRQAKELQTQRALAESAEASRFTELGTLVRNEIASSDQRIEAALTQMRSEIRESENSIAATLGEMDDRLQRASAPQKSQAPGL
jgi:uncharacterized integral membrane protein